MSSKLAPGTRMTHMKGMPYQFLFFARHSESQEELAIYECLYENTNGTLWARPRSMFEETAIRPDGSIAKRFTVVEETLPTGKSPALTLGVSAQQAAVLAARLGERASRTLAKRITSQQGDSDHALEDAYAALVFARETGEQAAVDSAQALLSRLTRV